MFINPLYHEDIMKKVATSLDANQVLVVYRRETDDSVNRYLQHGPQIFIPQPNEWYYYGQ